MSSRRSSSRATHRSADTTTTPNLIPANSNLPLADPSHPHRFLPNPSTWPPHNRTAEDNESLYGFAGEREAHPQTSPDPPAGLRVHLINQDLIARLVPKLDREGRIASKNLNDRCNLWVDSREPGHEVRVSRFPLIS